MVAILPWLIIIAIALLSLCTNAKLILLALLETLNALPPRWRIILFFNLLDLEVGIRGFELGVAVEVGEVVALADGVGLLVGDVRETVVFHVWKLTNYKYKPTLTVLLFKGEVEGI